MSQEFNTKGIVLTIVAVLVLIVGLSFTGRIAENVPANKIVIIQDPVDGELHFYTSQGLYYQNFGTPTSYSKSVQYWFSAAKDQGEDRDQSIGIRFNDGGHADISGSVRIELPTDNVTLEELHTKYGSDEAIMQELIRPVYEKAVYMSGPLMSSKESYAEKRTKLIYYIEDQAVHGIYQTTTVDVKGIDPVTGKEKTITIVKIATDKNGKPIRDAKSPLQQFGIKTYNLSINKIKYDPKVEKQIEGQQMAIMGVQQAIADAKKAEQNAITAEQEGIAKAATAKWEREVQKAKAVVAAQERLEVAEFDNLTAQQRKEENIKLGEGEAARKKLVMDADGALEKKLATYEKVMTRAFMEIGKQKWVPDTQLNSGGTEIKSGGPMMDLLSMLTVKVAKDLALDMSIPNTK